MANAKVLAAALAEEGYRIISGGTDTHLMLVDVFQKGILGSEAEYALGQAGITVNKNAIPYDTNPPMKPSGIRIGTPALTTRGMKEPEMRVIAGWIVSALEHRADAAKLAQIRGEVLEMAERFPLYGWLRAVNPRCDLVHEAVPKRPLCVRHSPSPAIWLAEGASNIERGSKRSRPRDAPEVVPWR